MKWLYEKIDGRTQMRFGHGIVRRYYNKDECLTVLVPFNVICRFVITIYEFIKYPLKLWWEK